MAAAACKETKSKVFDPRAWGLSPSAIKRLGERLYPYWERYAEGFTTQTCTTSFYALDYLSGLLRMMKERNFTNIAHTTRSVATEHASFYDKLALARARSAFATPQGSQDALAATDR